MGFYGRYAWRNLRRGGLWTALAVFCVATGVAAVVAMRGLGLAIGDSLIENARIDLKGDIRLYTSDGDPLFAAFGGEDSIVYSANDLATIQQQAEANGWTWSAYARAGSTQVARIDQSDFGRPSFVDILYINPADYPSSHQIVAEDPAGVPLGELFSRPDAIVISRNLAELQSIDVGDTVRVGGTEQPFVVTGIVGAEHEASIRNLFASFFGYAYLSFEAARTYISPQAAPNNIGISLPLDSSVELVNSSAARLYRQMSAWGYYDTRPRVIDRNSTVARIIGDFIVVLGLGAMLIGGVGIMNTMLVMVRRRTAEIAVLKTMGLKGRQIAALFFAEATLLGMLGSVVGCILGVLLGRVVNQYGETFIAQSLPWRIYPEALLYGVALGMVTSIAFGLAPIMNALQVRPAVVLRPADSVIPRLGWWRGALVLLLLVVVAGLMVGQIVRPSFALVGAADGWPYVVGLAGVAGTLIVLGVILALLWVLVWLLGKLPSFGLPDVRLAIRNLATQRGRTATTLLALTAGMFALSIITFLGAGARELLNVQLTRQVGGNVLALPIAPGDLGAGIARFALDGALAGVAGIEQRNEIAIHGTRLLQVDGVDVDELLAANAAELEALNVEGGAIDANDGVRFIWSGMLSWDTSNPDLYASLYRISAGRNLTEADRGQRVMIGPAQFAAPLDIEVGSALTYRINGEIVTFTIVGLTGDASGGALSALGGGVAGIGTTIPPESYPGSSDFTFFSYQVQPEHVNEALVALSSVLIPPTLSFDVSFLDSLVGRLVQQFAAIPTLVGLLSLAAAAVIMANTIALATLERRRQIGTLKALGLHGWRVLLVLLLETGSIGLLSAALGLGLSSLGVALLTSLGGVTIPLPQEARLTALALVLAAIGIAIAATFISAHVVLREKPLNVLRYED